MANFDIEKLFLVRILRYNREETKLIYFEDVLSIEEKVKRVKEWCGQNGCSFIYLEPRPAIAVIPAFPTSRIENVPRIENKGKNDRKAK